MFLPFLKGKRPKDSKHKQDSSSSLVAGNSTRMPRVWALVQGMPLHVR